MIDFARICPRCGHVNAEYESACTSCSHFIGMEAAVPRPDPAPTQSPAEVDEAVDAEPPPSPAPRGATEEHSFYLELAGSDRILTVKPGWRMGQAHESNEAEVQIPAEHPGCEFVHREHCRFDHTGEHWVVVPIAQTAHGQDFTNPTFVNQEQLQEGEATPIHHGDVLRLSGVRLTVRFIR